MTVLPSQVSEPTSLAEGAHSEGSNLGEAMFFHFLCIFFFCLVFVLLFCFVFLIIFFPFGLFPSTITADP